MTTQTLPISKQVILPDVLLSFAYLARARVNKNAEGKVTEKFELDAVFAPIHAALKIMKDAMNEIAKNAWGEAPMKIGVADQATGVTNVVEMPAYRAMLQQFQTDKRLPLKDGNRRKKIEAPYEGNLYVHASNARRPRIVVTRQGVNVEIGHDDPMFPYSGCRANVIVDLWCQGCPAKPAPPDFGSRINASLIGVQFLAHGEKFGGGGRIASLDEFGICPADADSPAPVAAASGATSLI